MKKTLVFLCACAPWLNPFAPGPSPATAPLLFAWLCAALALYLVFTNQMFAKRLVFVAAWSWLVAGLIGSGIGLLQYFGANSILSPLINQTNYGEAFANLRQRNQFASLTNIALAALVFVVLKTTECGFKRTKTVAALGLAAAGLLAVGNAISSSRTGLFELVLLCILYALWGQWRLLGVRRILICAVTVYAVALFAMPYLAGLDPLEHGAIARMDNDLPCAGRLTLWSNVLQLIAQKPWLGWGWGELDYAHFITLYSGPRFCDILDNAHNLPLHLAVELGVPAAVLICGGFSWWVLRQKPWAERDAARQMAWAVMSIILLHSMLEYPLWYGPFQMAFALCVILLWRRKPLLGAENSSNEASNQPLAQYLYASAALILIALVSYAAWDYRRISQIYLQPESRDDYYRSDTLNKIRSSWLFADQVRFAELMVTPLTQATAAWTFNTASLLLHYSPESRVIEKLIESAVMLGRDDAALAYLVRYKAAFPAEHAAWASNNKKALRAGN